MRISLNWLRTLVEVTLPPEELAEILTMAGFEVEDIEDRRAWAEGVVLGKVVDCQPHPNADKLRVCQVELGASSPSTIVCGAANVQTGQLVAVATVGSYLPKIDLKIKTAKLRGVASSGMICSLAELGLTKESEGIHTFTPEVVGDRPLGSDVRPLLGLDDVILDLTSTANRADALSMVGIAREVAALTGATLTLPEIPAVTPPATPALTLTIADSHNACPQYMGTLIESVQIAPSPLWLQQRLQASGIRPINNIVDITNYILLEWGQPLHGFDLDRLKGLGRQPSGGVEIGVRFARSGETLKTLDGQERKLQEQNLVITAQGVPVALAGVMGGEETEVHSGTTRLLLEAAAFDSAVVRRSARAQGLRTEASTRYERGVNLVELPLACRRALGLIQELAGGQITGQTASIAATPHTQPRSIELRLASVQQLLGQVRDGDRVRDLQAKDVERTLTALGCTLAPTKSPQTWHVSVPTYRYRDLEREVDLIEEVARLYGYNQFCDTLPKAGHLGTLPPQQQALRHIRAALQGTGLTELIHYSLVKPQSSGAEPLGRSASLPQIVLENPIFAEYSALRTDLIPGLIDAFQHNLEQGNGALNGYELGRIFWANEQGLQEADRLGGIIGGDPSQGIWHQGGKERPLGWFEAKGLLENVFDRLGLTVTYLPEAADDRLHPGRTASLWLKEKPLGLFGQLHPQLRQDRGLPEAVYVFELDLETLITGLQGAAELTRRFRSYSTYPAADRDLAFFVSTQVPVADLTRTMNQAGAPLLESVELFDEYRGGQGSATIPEGSRSLAFRLVYRASDRTLTEAEVETVHQAVREALQQQFEVTLRS